MDIRVKRVNSLNPRPTAYGQIGNAYVYLNSSLYKLTVKEKYFKTLSKGQYFRIKGHTTNHQNKFINTDYATMEIAPFEINESHIQALIAPTPIDLGDVGKIASLAQDELVAISGSLVKTAPKTTTDKTTLQIATMTDEKRVTGQYFKVKFWAGNQEDVVTAMERFTTYSLSSMMVELWQGAVQFNATLDSSIKKLQEDLKIDAANIEGVDFAEKLVLTSVGEYPVDDDVLDPEQAFQVRRVSLVIKNGKIVNATILEEN